MIEDNAASRPAMSSSQRFCLRWNNHQSNLLSVFDQLLHDESFVDVTLAVEGLFLKAHKMVLSACSPYFQTLFVHNPDKHPIVILKDVPYADMRSLLDFMYRGEVSVDQDRLTAFLRVAESLRIKGLTEVNEERCDLPTITSSLLSSAAAAAASASSSAATATPPPLQPQPTPPSQPSAVATPPIMPTAPAPSASPIALTSTPPPAPPPAHPPPPASSSSPMLERPTRPPPPAIPMPPKRSAPSPVHGAPPKRKRGRPRKLSGSDQTTTKRPQVTPKAEPSATGSSESTPGASPAREKLGTSSPSADRSDVKSSEGRITRESKTRDGGGSKDTLLLSSALALDSRVKDDPEPTPGTSTQDVAQGYGSPAVTPDAEAYASVPDQTSLPSLITPLPPPSPGHTTSLWYLPIGSELGTGPVSAGVSLSISSDGSRDVGEVVFGRSCEQCGRHFTHASTYKRHIKYVHGAHKDRKCVCDICGADLCRPDNLRRHKKLSHRGSI